jgi:zinc protease
VALSVIVEQFQLIKDQGVTATELQHAKQYLRGRLALSMEDGLGASIFHGRQWLLENKVTAIEDILDQVDQVTLQQAKMVANELFIPAGLNVAAIGPQVDESALLACLK